MWKLGTPATNVRQSAITRVCVTIAVAACAALGAHPANAFLARPAIFAKLDVVAKAPNGWLRFCADQPKECRPTPDSSDDLQLTPEKLQQLYVINAHVNDRVKYTTDKALYGETERWAMPFDRGDCEDIVLLKRRLLSEAGWPAGALLVTVVQGRAGDVDRHAVLTVRTDRGEMILDNLTPEILFWYETSYRYLLRQSSRDPNVWLAFSMSQPRPEQISSARP
ncbi:transglutaminase-like cysteine peptidase [Bradyrhizobium sp. HKCCYLS3077]|uniref:transglutaminase-like cysteine peptidase n=1 Tax=Bradyrhizobium sp. HKCCYLS3077 TaxID=3420761 RepID=UPI003EBFD935